MILPILNLVLRIFCILSNMYTITIVVTNFSHLKKYRYFLFLFSSGLIQMLYASFSSIKLLDGSYHQASTVSYLIIEFSIIFYYFFSNIKLKYTQFLMLMILLLALILGIDKIEKLGNLNFITESEFYVFESIIFIVLSIIHIIQILEMEDNIPLTQNPLFIITSSIFIFYSITCPAYFLDGYFDTKKLAINKIIELYSDLSYIFLNILLAKAFLCHSHKMKRLSLYL